MEVPSLKRSISLPHMVLYGLGTMIGGGIYALLGKVVGEAGMYAPVAFLIAAVIATITAFAYAELSGRLPYSAGEVTYIDTAFKKKWLSILIGCLVLLTGIVSCSTLTVASAGFVHDLFSVMPDYAAKIFIIITLGIFAIWGISQTIILVSIISLIEIAGLLFVIFMGTDALVMIPERLPELVPTTAMPPEALIGIFSAAFLAFYAFIGFEDMVNVAEEVKDVHRVLPLSVLLCVGITTMLYILVTLVAVLSVEPETLKQSLTPMAEILGMEGEKSDILVRVISLIAALNGILVQIVMVSRVLFGMAQKGKAPRFLASIYPKTQTPVKATIVALGTVFILALFLDLSILARITSTVILFVFLLINLSLIRIKHRGDAPPKDIRTYPLWLPYLGIAAIVFMLVFQGYLLLI